MCLAREQETDADTGLGALGLGAPRPGHTLAGARLKPVQSTNSRRRTIGASVFLTAADHEWSGVLCESVEKLRACVACRVCDAICDETASDTGDGIM